MESTEPAGPQWERWYSLATTFVAPATFVSALLFYFGYVSSRSQYHYFGIDVDTIGLSTQDYVMRSPQALLVPALVIPLAGALVLLAREVVERRQPSPGTVRRIGAVGAVVALTGLGMVFAYAWVGDWAPYPLVTPLLLGVGVGVLAWAAHRAGLRRSVVVLAVLVVVVCVFWSTATLAQWTGTGAAQRTARNLDVLPAVVVDTRERLYLTDGIVAETVLPTEEDQQFHYRYRNLRLLIHGEDAMFLVPSRWSAGNSTLMLPLDDSVRVRFRFVDVAP